MAWALTLSFFLLFPKDHSSKLPRYVQHRLFLCLIKIANLPQYVRPRGTVVAIGLPAGAFLKAPVFESVVRMITIKGSYVGNRRDTAEALEFYRQGKVKAPYKVVGLSELPKVFDLMHKNQIAGRYVLDNSK